MGYRNIYNCAELACIPKDLSLHGFVWGDGCLFYIQLFPNGAQLTRTIYITMDVTAYPYLEQQERCITGPKYMCYFMW